MKKFIHSEKIAISDLNLWDENARFPEEYFNKSEKHLISYFLNKKDFKIELLAKEIVDEFDLPQIEKIVVYAHKNKNIILEGNRRVVVYKLLADPSLTNDSNIRTLFTGLNKKISIDNSFKLEALVTPDKNAGLRYVDRKHTRRNNEVAWGEQERHNYKVRRGNASAKTEIFRYELGKLVRKLDLPDEIKDSVLGKGAITTFYRLIDSEPASKILEYQKNEDGTIKTNNQKELNEKLKIVAFDIATKRVIDGEKLDSRFLNKTGQKEKYLKSIGNDDSKRVEKEIKDNTLTDIFGNKVLKLKSQKSIYVAKIKQFQSLIDPVLLLPGVKSDKIKDVFGELQKIQLDLCPTGSALLLRTLMEISVAEFADQIGISVDNSGYFRTSTGKTKESLKEKIDYIAENYANQEIKDCVKVFNGNSVFTENLNKIAHNRFIFSSKEKVKDLWRDSRSFWEFLIAKIIEKENAK